MWDQRCARLAEAVNSRDIESALDAAISLKISSAMVGGVRLANPLILAAMYYDTAILRRAMGLGFGAVTTKSITVNPRNIGYSAAPPPIIRPIAPAPSAKYKK